VIKAKVNRDAIEVDGYARIGCMYDRSACEGNIRLLICLFVGVDVQLCDSALRILDLG